MGLILVLFVLVLIWIIVANAIVAPENSSCKGWAMIITLLWLIVTGFMANHIDDSISFNGRTISGEKHKSYIVTGPNREPYTFVIGNGCHNRTTRVNYSYLYGGSARVVEETFYKINPAE